MCCFHSLATSNPDVTCRHIRVGANVAIELAHEALAETHDLSVRLAFRVEVGTSLSTSHRKRGQAVLEDLLEGEELEDAHVHGRVKAQLNQNSFSVNMSLTSVFYYPLS